MVPTSSIEPAAAAGTAQGDAALLARHGARLLALARQSISWRVQRSDPLEVDPAQYPPELGARRASFVTLTKAGQLRGCVGTPPTSAWCSLVQDVASNAAAAAVEDSRFAPLDAGELDAIEIAVSLLSAAIPLAAASEPELIDKLRPGIDGLLLHEDRRQALFLPQVWEHLTKPVEFVAQLKAKAGLPREYWSASLEFRRFTAASIAEPARAAAR
jgi:AmmeMemoRadiSam system protein A